MKKERESRWYIVDFAVRSAHTATLTAVLVSAGLITSCWPYNPVDDCEENITLACYSSGTSGDGGTPPACIPSENDTPVDDSCGVFVSSSSGDDGGDGSKAKPLKSLAAAVEMAAAKGMPVYACAEEHAGSVTLAGGMGLYGGLDCTSKWAYVGGTKRSVLLGSVDEVALTITKTAGGAEVADFVIRAADAKTAGSSSIAVLAEGVTAELVRCELVAGNGAAGATGAPGDPNGMTAAMGAAGSAGTDACGDLDGMPGPDAKLAGGDAVTNDCGAGDVSVGGQGGDGNLLFGGGGDVGQTGTAGQAGAGEPAMGMWSCVGGNRFPRHLTPKSRKNDRDAGRAGRRWSWRQREHGDESGRGRDRRRAAGVSLSEGS